MTLPRRITPGATYFITRRCVDRQFLLRPDARLNAILAYCLARAMAETAVQVHAFVGMSNHIHAVVTDVKGELPLFCQNLFREIACAVKVLRGKRGQVFEPGSYSAVELVTEEAVFDKLAYVICNPVAAGLVRHASEWKGVAVGVGTRHGTSLRAPRPPEWFDADSLQDSYSATLTPPPCWPADEMGRLVDALEAEVEHRERLADADRHERGVGVLGMKKVLRTDPFSSPNTIEPAIDRDPVFAAVTRAGRRAAALALREWRNAYRAALALWTSGAHDCEFPYGTWRMRVFCGCNCGSP